jgi:uncharacterized membrane protein YkgB
MKYCVQCGRELESGSRFCTNCGAINTAETQDVTASVISAAPFGNAVPTAAADSNAMPSIGGNANDKISAFAQETVSAVPPPPAFPTAPTAQPPQTSPMYNSYNQPQPPNSSPYQRQPYAQYNPAPQAFHPGNGTAIASLVLGIVGIVFIMLYIGWIFGIIGLVLARVSNKAQASVRQEPLALSKAGMVTSIVALVLGLLGFLFIVAIIVIPIMIGYTEASGGMEQYLTYLGGIF